MRDNSLWRMFCDTGDPVCYLIYRYTATDKKGRADFPPAESLAFSGTKELSEAPDVLA